MEKRIYKTRGNLPVAEIIRMYLAGYGTRHLAELNGSTRGAVCSILRHRKISRGRYGGPALTLKKGERIKGTLTATEIVERYAEGDGESILCLAVADGTTPAIIGRILRKAGADTRLHRSKRAVSAIAKRLGIATETYLRLAAIKTLGNKCTQCPEVDIRVLQLNHIGEKKRIPHYADYMKIIRLEKSDEVFDVRCANCNLRYEFERGRRKPYPAEWPEIPTAVSVSP